MTTADWLEATLNELIKRANEGNLFIGTQGRSPPGPVVVTHDEDRETLDDIRIGLGLGSVRTMPNCMTGPKLAWVAYDEEAIKALILLIPYLRKQKGREAMIKKSCAGRLINQWKIDHK